MKIVKSILATALLAMGINANAQATYTEGQTEYTFKPHMFLQLQAGGAYTLGEAKFTDLLSPTAQIALGYQFSPVWALRLAAAGWESKGGWGENSAKQYGFADNTYKWKYVAPSLDVKFNIINAIAGWNPKRVFGLNLIAGVGANIAFDHDGIASFYQKNPLLLSHYPAVEGTSIRPVGKFGMDLDFNVSKRVSINVEGNANLISDQYNSKHTDNADWYFNALAGVKVALGKTYEEKNIAPVYQTVVDTVWYDETAYKEIEEDGNMSWTVFYEIRESDFTDPNAQLTAIGKFLAEHKGCKVTVKSYADRGTGNPKINMGYSQQRSEKAVAALKQAGVSESVMTAEYFGDTVQPFEENDKNRCTIITATGLKPGKKPYTVKKFRTSERQVRVN